MPLRLGSRQLSVRWPWLLLTAAGIALFVSLGQWQWGRAAEKRQMEQAFAAGSARIQPLGDRPVASLPRYARIETWGRYDPAHQFLLDNLSRDGRAGYEVLTPLLLPDGRALLVNRGWLPLPDGGRGALPDISMEDGSDRPVSGRIDELPVTGIDSGRAPPAVDGSWPKRTSFPRSQELAAALGRAIEPRQLLLATDQPLGYRRDWQPASAGFGPERHLAYAVQWWSFAALALVLFVVVNLKRIPHESH